MITPKIRIGNQTSCHVPPNQPFDFALRAGFDAFEWFSDPGRFGWSEDDCAKLERDELRRIANAHALLFSVHAPHMADPTTRVGAQAIMKSIQFGGDVRAGVVNIHLFPEHSAFIFAESLGPLIDAARMMDVRISIENTPHTSPDSFNHVFELLSVMPEATNRVGMCLDSGHANLFEGTRNDYLLFVDLLEPHVPIIHWHAHENWGDRDSHLPLFTGPASQGNRIKTIATIARGYWRSTGG